MANEMEDNLDCGGCNKSLEEVIYWKHIKRLRFCVVHCPDFQDKLPIPKKFAENMKPNVFHPKVTLRGPSGASWEVTLLNSVDGVFLRDGWEEFVNAHCLQENEILFFKYDRNSSFDVKIFNGQCEKEAAYFVKKCGHVNPARILIKMALQTKMHLLEIKSSLRLMKSALLMLLLILFPCAVEYVSHRRHVTEEEKTAALRKAASELVERSFFAALPFSSCYKGYYMVKDYFMSIPAKFAAEHFRCRNEDVILRVGEKKWLARYCFSTDKLGSGWRQFALDNNLEESDVCLFKLVSKVNAETMMFDVTIFRVVEEVTPLTALVTPPPVTPL